MPLNKIRKELILAGLKTQADKINIIISNTTNGAEKVYESDRGVVLKINTKEASIHYGSDTEWDISARDGNSFDQNHKSYNIYFILNKKLPIYDHEKKVVVFVDHNNEKIYYNVLDEEIDHLDIDFRVPDSVYKRISYQDALGRFDTWFKSELDGNVFEDTFTLPYYMVKNGELIYDFSDIVFEHHFIAMNKGLRTFKKFPKEVLVLDVSNNKIESLKGLPEKVGVLKAAGNNLYPLEGLPEGLVELDLYNNNITSLKGLPNSLTHLNLSSNKIESLEGLPSNLKKLIIHASFVKSLIGLPEKLNFLSVGYNRVESIEGLPKKLDYLDISNNPGKFTKEEVRAVCDVRILKV